MSKHITPTDTADEARTEALLHVPDLLKIGLGPHFKPIGPSSISPSEARGLALVFLEVAKDAKEKA